MITAGQTGTSIRIPGAGGIKSACRSCGKAVVPVLDLGETPLANSLSTGPGCGFERTSIPLRLMLCPGCTLLQLAEIVSPAEIFNERYPYFSSVSAEFVSRARDHVIDLDQRCGLGSDSLVVEIASNDGYLLQHFVERGIPVLGIDPSTRQARAAAAKGIETIPDFFSPTLAERLSAEGRKADVLIANNVLAHVPDINGFVAGVARLLKPGGLAVFEVPYAVEMLERCAFDTVYHEHVFYFTVTALQLLFERHGLVIEHVETLDVHGGSIRVTVNDSTSGSPAADRLLAREREQELGSPRAYEGFAGAVARVRRELPALLGTLQRDGARIAAYGAAAKGVTLLSTCGIDADLIDFVVDLSVHKQGLYMPGTGLPVYGTDQLKTRNPHYLLLLAWNFEKEIRAQQADYLARGNRFVVPVPIPRVVT